MTALTTSQHIGDIPGELETALFFAPDTPLWRYPVTLIRNAKADKEANIWFFLRNVAMEDDLRAAAFFAQLQFYNKSRKYYLKVQGEATVENVPVEATEFRDLIANTNGNDFLIKLRVSQANIYRRAGRRSAAIL